MGEASRCGASGQEHRWTSLVALIKNLPSKAGNVRPGFDPWLGRSPGEGHGNPPQYSCLENAMDRGAWPATGRRVTESDTSETTGHAQMVRMCLGQGDSTACHKEQTYLKLRVVVLFSVWENEAAGAPEILPEACI